MAFRQFNANVYHQFKKIRTNPKVKTDGKENRNNKYNHIPQRNSSAGK